MSESIIETGYQYKNKKNFLRLWDLSGKECGLIVL